MGCGASVATTNSNQPIRRPIDASQHNEVSKEMAAVQGSAKMIYEDHFEHCREKKIIQIYDGRFTGNLRKLIETDDIVEFQTIDESSYDVIQVYQDGNDFYEVPNGFHFYGLHKRTDTTKSRFVLSLKFEENETSILFCVMKSTANEKSTKQRKFPKSQCEQNLLIIQKPEFSFDLTDEKINQKVYLHQSDQIKLKWSSDEGIAYRIEERRYCPVSGGFYTVDEEKNETSRRGKIKGQFTRRFEDLGTSFLCRLTDKNELHDVTICVVTGAYQIKRIEFEENAIKPYSIEIEQGHSIEFVWSTKRKLTFYQIDSFHTDPKTRKSIKMNKDGENFFWPFDPMRRGQCYFQFHEPGIFRFKVENDQIGTIIVTPRQQIHRITFPTNEFVRKFGTNDFVLFEWEMSELKDDSVSIMIDPDTSVIPDDANGLRGLYGCSDHRCSSGRNELHRCFQTAQAFLMNFPKHGLFQLSHLQRTDTTLFSLIVENGIDNHYAEYDDRRIFVDKTIVVNQNDRVWFESSNRSQIGFVYQTDEFGQRLNSTDLIFEPQRNSSNNFYKQFDQLGIFYFSVDFTPEKIWKNTSTPVTPLAVVVVPDIKFHYNFISKDRFENEPILTNVNDFVIWQFESPISPNVVQLSSKSTINDLNDCHNLSRNGRNRHCLGLECARPGAFFFANPEFERFAGTHDGRLLSTVIIDVPFGEKCFVVSADEFLPEILHVAEGQTISWILPSDRVKHRITVKRENDPTKPNEKTFIDRDFSTFLDGVHYLHTFHHVGRYEIRSDAFENSAIVIVETEKTIQSQRKRVSPPEVRPPLEIVSQVGQKTRLVCPNRTAKIYYSVDGSMPTRFTGNVLKYNDEEGLVLNDPGLQVVRAFAFEEEKVLSDVITSTPTYVMQNAEVEAAKELQNLWATTRLSLAVSLQKPNKIYGNIQVEPSTILDLVDHFEFFVNDVEQSVRLASNEFHFSAEGFAGGEQYEVCVVAYPKSTLTDASPILSNKRAFEIQRELPSGGPLLSLIVPDDLTSIILIWPNIGDHIDEYVLHVNNVPTKIISGENFQDSFGVQLLGAQHNRDYLLHVEAKIRENQRTCKSNSLSIRLPLQRSVAEISDAQHVPYITVVKERAPSDVHFEEFSVRISSPKLSSEKSSSFAPSHPLPSTSSSPGVSSRPSLHLLDINSTTLSTSDIRNDKKHQNIHEDKMNQTEILHEASPIEKQHSDETPKRKSILSDDAKRQADLLLNQLTKSIENEINLVNSRCPHVHNNYPGIQHYKDLQRLSQLSSRSSDDPYTTKLPPKPQRRSVELNKTSNHHQENSVTKDN